MGRGKTKGGKGKARSPKRDWSALDRRMIAEDGSWLQAVALSAQTDADWEGVMGLAIVPHCARIVHEGHLYLTHKSPAAAQKVRLTYAREIEAARHTVKLLDDTSKLYAGVIADFERIAEAHEAILPTWNDFVVVSRDGQVFTTSRVSDFQGAFTHKDIASRVTGKESRMYNLGYDMGAALPAITMALNIAWPAEVSVPLPEGQAPKPHDVTARKYYARRFEPEFSDALKDVLTVIESSVNASLLLFAPSADSFVGPVFRARFVTTVHALRALREILERHPGLAGRNGVGGVQAVLDMSDSRYLISDAVRYLRNRCMHYGIPSHLTNLAPNAPAYGLVEATTGDTYSEVNKKILDTLGALSAALRSWGT